MIAPERLSAPCLYPAFPTSCAGTQRRSALELRQRPWHRASEDTERALISTWNWSPRSSNRRSPTLRHPTGHLPPRESPDGELLIRRKHQRLTSNYPI